MERLTALRTFCAVVEHGSFAAAARSLSVSDAGVSKNIRELETHLGTRLLNRTTRKMSLTDAGSAYHKRVSALLDDLEDADETARQSSEQPHGTLRVTAPMSFGLQTITPMIAAFKDAYPAIDLILTLDDGKRDIMGGRFDLAIRIEGEMEDSSLIVRRLAVMPRVLCASPQYLKRHPYVGEPGELSRHECLIYTNWNNPNEWTLVNDGATTTVDVSGSYHVNSSIAIKDAALGNLGIASIPKIFVQKELDQSRLIELPGGWHPPSSTVRAVYPQGKFLPARVRVLLDFLIERLAGTEGHSTLTV